MSDNTIFYANEALFDYVLARYYDGIASEFNGSQVDDTLGLYYEFRTIVVPVIDLSPQSDGGNCAVRLNQIEVKTYDWENGKRGALIDTTVVQVAITGVLGLSGQNIAITSLHATTEGGQDDRAIAREMDKHFVPRLQDLVRKVPLPDFKGVLDLDAEITSASVANRMVQATARLGGTGEGVAPDWTPQTSTDPTIYAAISTSGVNELLKVFFADGVTKSADVPEHSSWGFGFRANAWARAYNPNITISGGSASGTIDGSAGTSVGVEGFGVWTDVPISLSMGMPPMGLSLEESGKTAILTFHLNGSVSLSADLPSILGDAVNEFLGMINFLANSITSGINDVLGSIRISLFDLPDKIPGTDIDANLEFSSLGISGNSLVTSIVVK